MTSEASSEESRSPGDTFRRVPPGFRTLIGPESGVRPATAV
jgi:hypothetical protein